MADKPHPTILDRDIPPVLARQHFGSQLELLRDLANYGSNLIIRSFHSSPKKLADLIACGVLLKQLVTMVDSVEVLVSAGCGLTAHLPARTAFEASLYLDWIFKEDSERRATRYLVANYRQERLWASRAIRGTAEASAMEEATAGLGLDIHAKRPTLSTDAATYLAEVNRVLSQPELATIDQEFEEAKRKNPRRKLEWYSFDGITSIRQMARKMKRLAEYQFFYSRGAEISHSARYKDHIEFRSNQVHFIEIRQLTEARAAINFISSDCIRTYRKFLERYRPGEIPAFQKKYLEDWRESYMQSMGVVTGE